MEKVDIIRTVYRAIDGKDFDDEKVCIKYEERLRLENALKPFFDRKESNPDYDLRDVTLEDLIEYMLIEETRTAIGCALMFKGR